MTDHYDITLEYEGSIILFRPNTSAARAWIEESVQPEPWQWWGDGLAVEPRYAASLLYAMMDDGLTFTKERDGE